MHDWHLLQEQHTLLTANLTFQLQGVADVTRCLSYTRGTLCFSFHSYFVFLGQNT